MKDGEFFYCLRCNKMLHSDLAQPVFRTGYYRVTHPLGCCESCRRNVRENVESDPVAIPLQVIEQGG